MSAWYHDAACRGLPLRLWFTAPGESVDPGKRICHACPVRRFCLEDVLAWEGGVGTSARDGIAGGLTPAERTAEWRTRVAAGAKRTKNDRETQRQRRDTGAAA